MTLNETISPPGKPIHFEHTILYLVLDISILNKLFLYLFYDFEINPIYVFCYVCF